MTPALAARTIILYCWITCASSRTEMLLEVPVPGPSGTAIRGAAVDKSDRTAGSVPEVRDFRPTPGVGDYCTCWLPTNCRLETVRRPPPCIAVDENRSSLKCAKEASNDNWPSSAMPTTCVQWTPANTARTTACASTTCAPVEQLCCNPELIYDKIKITIVREGRAKNMCRGTKPCTCLCCCSGKVKFRT